MPFGIGVGDDHRSVVDCARSVLRTARRRRSKRSHAVFSPVSSKRRQPGSFLERCSV